MKSPLNETLIHIHSQRQHKHESNEQAFNKKILRKVCVCCAYDFIASVWKWNV